MMKQVSLSDYLICQIKAECILHSKTFEYFIPSSSIVTPLVFASIPAKSYVILKAYSLWLKSRERKHHRSIYKFSFFHLFLPSNLDIIGIIICNVDYIYSREEYAISSIAWMKEAREKDAPETLSLLIQWIEDRYYHSEWISFKCHLFSVTIRLLLGVRW